MASTLIVQQRWDGIGPQQLRPGDVHLGLQAQAHW